MHITQFLLCFPFSLFLMTRDQVSGGVIPLSIATPAVVGPEKNTKGITRGNVRALELFGDIVMFRFCHMTSFFVTYTVVCRESITTTP